MPPSRIPEAQVQAILAELRENGGYVESGAATAAAAAPPWARPKHTAGMVAAIVASALMVGLAFSPLSDLVWSRPEAPPKAAAAPIAPLVESAAATPVQQVTAEPLSAPASAQPVPAKRTLATKAATTKPAAPRTAPSRPKSRCLAGGPCGRADVAIAERRLRAAYASAQKAGVERSDLAYAKLKWDSQRRRYAKSPRTSVRTLRAVAADLNRKAAAARADR